MLRRGFLWCRLPACNARLGRQDACPTQTGLPLLMQRPVVPRLALARAEPRACPAVRDCGVQHGRTSRPWHLCGACLSGANPTTWGHGRRVPPLRGPPSGEEAHGVAMESVGPPAGMGSRGRERKRAWPVSDTVVGHLRACVSAATRIPELYNSGILLSGLTPRPRIALFSPRGLGPFSHPRQTHGPAHSSLLQGPVRNGPCPKEKGPIGWGLGWTFGVRSSASELTANSGRRSGRRAPARRAWRSCRACPPCCRR